MADYTLRVDAGLFCNVEADTEEEARQAASDFLFEALRGFTVLATSPGESGELPVGAVTDLRVYADDGADFEVMDVYDRDSERS